MTGPISKNTEARRPRKTHNTVRMVSDLVLGKDDYSYSFAVPVGLRVIIPSSLFISM
jgi:hypothetical protein